METPDTLRDSVLKEAFACRLELMAYARSLMGSYTAAEDVVQAAMLVVARKPDQFQPGTSMLAWCRAIVRLEVLRAKQQRHRERTLAERLVDDAIDAAFEQFQASTRSDDSDLWQAALQKCLQSVSERGRNVLRARFVTELSYEQISEHLEMTIEAVRKSLFRTKKQVRTCVEDRLRGTQ